MKNLIGGFFTKTQPRKSLSKGAQPKESQQPVDKKADSVAAEPITYNPTAWTGDTEGHYLTKLSRKVGNFFDSIKNPRIASAVKTGATWGLVGGIVASPLTAFTSIVLGPALGAFAGGVSEAGEIYHEKAEAAAAEDNAKKEQGLARLENHFGESFDSESVSHYTGDQMIAFADRSEAFRAKVDALPEGEQRAFLAEQSKQLGERIEAAKAKAQKAPGHHLFG